MKEKYPFITKMNTNDVLRDLLGSNDDLDERVTALEESGGGTEVIANPTLAGTEDALEGLQVGDTKYKVGGGHLYLHNVELYVPSSQSYQGEYWSFNIYTNNAEPFNVDTLRAFITNITSYTYIPMTFRINGSSTNNKIYLNCYLQTMTLSPLDGLGKVLHCSEICIDLSNNTLTSTSAIPHYNDNVNFNHDKVIQIL